MANNPLTNELQQFMARYIHSVEQLEILRYLSENQDRSWPESEVFKIIQSSHASVTANLRHFVDEGILVQDSQETYRFAPSSPELARMALELVESYRIRRVTVVEALYLMPPDAVRQFADAFRLRKNEK